MSVEGVVSDSYRLEEHVHRVVAGNTHINLSVRFVVSTIGDGSDRANPFNMIHALASIRPPTAVVSSALRSLWK
jgi:hypothetical protein